MHPKPAVLVSIIFCPSGGIMQVPNSSTIEGTFTFFDELKRISLLPVILHIVLAPGSFRFLCCDETYALDPAK